MNIGLKELIGFMGGEDDAPELEEGTCSDLLVIRVADKGKDHTVFID